jgi:ribonuclease PH
MGDPETQVNRSAGRKVDELRATTFTSDIAPNAQGSVLVSAGNTRVICAVTVEAAVPRWMKEQGVSGGWITAEYAMLPYSTLSRKPRDITKGRLDGRSMEIQRLIGRALRSAVDLDKIGERTLWVDCDVLQADGGTRTAAITGASLALVLACVQLHKEGLLADWPVRCLVAATSVGIVQGQILVDLDYEEDRQATVDLNLVMTSQNEFVEVQGAGEEATFKDSQLDTMLGLGRRAVQTLVARQRAFLQERAPDFLALSNLYV